MIDPTGGQPMTQAAILLRLAEATRNEEDALTELIAAAEECAARLAIYVNSAPVDADRRLYERERKHGEANMAPVRRLRAAVARVRGE